MEEPPSEFNLIFLQILNPDLGASDLVPVLLNLFTIFLLIFLSAVFSGSENAFFSLTKAQLEELTEDETAATRAIQFLHGNPKKLLGTILIANTFVNIAVVMVTTGLFSILFHFESNPLFGFLLEVVFVTFMLVLLGEVIPKIYAFQNNVKVTRFVAVPMFYMYKIFQLLVFLLESTTAIIDKRVTKRGHVLSVDELTHAIDITSEKDAPQQEKSILKGIVNFGNTTVKQIMRQRPDILAVDETLSFKQLMVTIIDAGYSRVPVFQNNLDHIKGVLFTK
ncbi:MAG: CNNM domain-containing protein, partial [Bacteroidia bacterium]